MAPARRRAQMAWSVEGSAELPVSGGRPGEEGAVPLHGRTPAEKASPQRIRTAPGPRQRMPQRDTGSFRGLRAGSKTCSRRAGFRPGSTRSGPVRLSPDTQGVVQSGIATRTVSVARPGPAGGRTDALSVNYLPAASAWRCTRCSPVRERWLRAHMVQVCRRPCARLPGIRSRRWPPR